MSPAPGNMLSAVAVIPARFASERLPGKPLLPIGDRPLVQHVHDRVASCERVARVVVVTEDVRVVDAVRGFGGEVRLTRSDHQTGSDRIGEILPELAEDVIINVQGDEPEIPAELVDALVHRLATHEDDDVATAAAPYPMDTPLEDPDHVKVVLDRTDRALYFSRAPIPGRKRTESGSPNAGALLHLGVYAYRRAALERFLALPRGTLEVRESLEQLRLLENGISMGVVRSAAGHGGIDTAAELERFRRRYEEGTTGQRSGR